MRFILSLCLILPALSVAEPKRDLRPALDHLNVVFASARTKTNSLSRSFLYGFVSGLTVYSALKMWTGNPATARRIFWYSIAGNIGWGIAGGAADALVDSLIPPRASDVRRYETTRGLPDFFRLPVDVQYRLAKDNPAFERFLLRMDAALIDAGMHRPGSNATEPAYTQAPAPAPAPAADANW